MTEVEKLLDEKKVEFIRKGSDALVHCLNPEHDDSNPSMRIDVNEGMYHCLTCGYKGNIFLFFNRRRNLFNSKLKSIKDKMVDIRKASWSGLEIPQDAFFVSEDYFGLSSDVLKEFQAFRSSANGMEDRIVFPIYDYSNRIVAFQGRYTHSDAPPKYKVYPKDQSLSWMPNQYKTKPINGSIILVEGIKDMLFLRQHGFVNAVTTFGTKGITTDNIVDKLTPYMLLGTDKVYIMYDGDSAGRSAANNVERCITRMTDLLVEQIELPDGVDPAGLTNKQIKTLKNQLHID